MATVLTEEDVFPWAEARLGGRIIASTRQGGRESGGRPGWFLTLERPAGGTFRAYIRADRGGDFGFVTEYTVQREAKILKLLRAEGIPVPEVLASATQPNAMIQAFVEGMSDFTLVRIPRSGIAWRANSHRSWRAGTPFRRRSSRPSACGCR